VRTVTASKWSGAAPLSGCDRAAHLRYRLLHNFANVIQLEVQKYPTPVRLQLADRESIPVEV